jgi:Rod binding domain-containing protein
VSSLFISVQDRSTSVQGSTENTSGTIVGTKEQKLRKAAGEFESMLLANLWKSMKASLASDDDDATDPAHDTLDDWGIQAMSEAVGKNGGLGIGRLILKDLDSKIASEAEK